MILPDNADTLENAQTLALHYQRVAVEQGTRLIRMHIAISILRKWALGKNWNASAVLTIRDWIDGGMVESIPWPGDAFFEEWAATQHMENIDGFIGYRITMKMEPRP